MKAVGIKYLKNNLSRYIRLVRDGETVLVTDRGEVVAEIRSPGINTASRWESFLDLQERKGALKRAKRTTSSARQNFARYHSPKPKGLPSVQQLLDETRAERYE